MNKMQTKRNICCFIQLFFFFFWRAQVNYEHYPKMVVANYRSLVVSFTIVFHLSFVFIAVYLLRVWRFNFQFCGLPIVDMMVE